MNNSLYRCVVADLLSFSAANNCSTDQDEWTVIVVRDDPFGYEIPSKNERKKLSRLQIAGLNGRLNNAKQTLSDTLHAAVASLRQGSNPNTILPEIASRILKDSSRWIRIASGPNELERLLNTCEAFGDNCWDYGLVRQMGCLFHVVTWHDHAHA